MKNPILLFLAIVSILFNSSSLLSMNTKSILSSIDLKLKNKEAHIRTHGYISTYDWCCKIARNLVNEKRLAIMKILGVSQQELEELKKYRESQVKTIDYSHLEVKFSNQINESIINVLKNKSVSKILQIKNISINSGSISADTKNSIIPIQFLDMPKDCTDTIASSSTHNVFLSQNSYDKSLWWLETSSLECQIGHELAHILFKHSIEKYCFKKIYQDNKDKVSQSDFNLALRNFIISTEIQADIVGIFDNIQWAKDQWSCHHQKDLYKSDDYIDEERLPLIESANYFKEIYTSMESEIKKEAEPIEKIIPENAYQKSVILEKQFTKNPTKIAQEKSILTKTLLLKTMQKSTLNQDDNTQSKPVFCNYTKNNSQTIKPVNSYKNIEAKGKKETFINNQNYKNLIKTLIWLKNTVYKVGIKKTLFLSTLLSIYITLILFK